MSCRTFAECVGGGCDGVQLDPYDTDEPDDWPDMIRLEDKRTGVLHEYWLDSKPKMRNGDKVYCYRIPSDE